MGRLIPFAQGEDFQRTGAWFEYKRLPKISIMSPDLLMIYIHVLIEGAWESAARPTAWHGRPNQEARYPDPLCSVCLAGGPEGFAYPMTNTVKLPLNSRAAGVIS